MDFKELRIDKPYYRINREERNLAAILYHFLLNKTELEKFFILLQEKKYIDNIPSDYNKIEVYYEYAYLRDLWENIELYITEKSNIKLKRQEIIDKSNAIKKDLILSQFSSELKNKLGTLLPSDFNKYFGAKRTPSKKHIVSPANWSISSFVELKNEDFLKACKFKWCFNAKPDIVIHLDNNKAICIEAKLESGEGSYPTNEKDKNTFYSSQSTYTKPNKIKQIEIQKEIMKLLGIESEFVFLIKTAKGSEEKELTWQEIFNKLKIDDAPDFIQKWNNLK